MLSVYKLSIDEKKRILINNLHGVDVDPQAVEVTKLSLVLKMLEDENFETKDTLFKNTGVAVLPDLSVNNIKCGNSLICSVRPFQFVFAVIPKRSSFSGWERTISSVCVPMEPVEPSIKSLCLFKLWSNRVVWTWKFPHQ